MGSVALTRFAAWWAQRRKRILLTLYLVAAALLLAAAAADPLLYRLAGLRETALTVADFTPVDTEVVDDHTVITTSGDSQLLLQADNIRDLWVHCTFLQDPGEFVAFYQSDPDAPFSAKKQVYARYGGEGWYVFPVPYGTRKLRLDLGVEPSITVQLHEMCMNRPPAVHLPTAALVWAALLPGLLFAVADWMLDLWARVGPGLRRGINRKGGRPPMTVTKDTIIADILQNDPAQEAVAIFLSAGMHCLGCIAAHGETVAEACAVHGADADALVRELNGYFATLG